MGCSLYLGTCSLGVRDLVCLTDMTSAPVSQRLIDLVMRLETLGHEPAAIYETLAKKIDRKLARQAVRHVTGWEKPRQPIKPRERKPVSAETRAKMAASHRGKLLPLATRAKISASCKGKVRSPETRLKISQARKRMEALKRNAS